MRQVKEAGWLEAFADLLDPFAPFEKPRSTIALVRKQNHRRQLETRNRIEARARALSSK